MGDGVGVGAHPSPPISLLIREDHLQSSPCKGFPKVQIGSEFLPFSGFLNVSGAQSSTLCQGSNFLQLYTDCVIRSLGFLLRLPKMSLFISFQCCDKPPVPL